MTTLTVDLRANFINTDDILLIYPITKIKAYVNMHFVYMGLDVKDLIFNPILLDYINKRDNKPDVYFFGEAYYYLLKIPVIGITSGAFNNKPVMWYENRAYNSTGILSKAYRRLIT